MGAYAGVAEMLEATVRVFSFSPTPPEALICDAAQTPRDPDLGKMRNQAKVNIHHISVKRMARDTERVYREAVSPLRWRTEPVVTT